MGDALTMALTVLKLSVELSQSTIVPLYPDSVNVPLLAPAHNCPIGLFRFPPTEIPITETVNIPEVTGTQVPF